MKKIILLAVLAVLLPVTALADIMIERHPTYNYRVSNLDEYSNYVFFDNYFFTTYEPGDTYGSLMLLKSTGSSNNEKYRQLYAISREDYDKMPKNYNQPQEIKAYLDSLNEQGRLIKATNEIEYINRDPNDKPNEFITDIYKITSFTENGFTLEKIKTERTIGTAKDIHNTNSGPGEKESNPLNFISQIGIDKIIISGIILVFGITLGTVLGAVISKKGKNDF